MFTSLRNWGVCVVCNCRAEQLPRPLGVPGHVETAVGQVPEDSGGHDDPKEHQGHRLRVEVLPDSPLGLSQTDDLAHLAE